jgi:hypothetical protein
MNLVFGRSFSSSVIRHGFYFGRLYRLEETLVAPVLLPSSMRRFKHRQPCRRWRLVY